MAPLGLGWKFVCFLGVFINGAACMRWRFSLFGNLQEMIPPTRDRISGPGPILSRSSDCEEARIALGLMDATGWEAVVSAVVLVLRPPTVHLFGQRAQVMR